ncbi:hypothetical protein [Streptosporangium minutum]|uniref:Uncharacterized protein n=1 Tax=Streptosporangium minutum TaxID=569862 RepID=A0A243R7U4_9ACTN|nr:hypothetical protein [Streptosporangium minutum]OUC90663.1 hypothetical protein CA984_36310 [Streptosporangium minutum]
MGDRAPAELLKMADALMPGASRDAARLARGGIHDVVLLPGVAAVRISRLVAVLELGGKPLTRVGSYAEHIVAWLERNADREPPGS